MEGQKLAIPVTTVFGRNSRLGTARSGSLTPRNRSRERGTVRDQNILSRVNSPPRGNHRTTERSKRNGHETDDSRQGSDEELERQKRSKIPLLEKDISVIMRQRAEKGYGLDPVRNRRLVKDGLAELWSWIEHAASMSANGRAYVDQFDFEFKGVLPILRGFSPHETAKPATAPNDQFHSRRSKTVSQPSGPKMFEDVKSNVKRNDAARTQDAAFARAAAALNKKNGSTPFTISSKPAQRQLALSSIGPDFASADVASVIRRYEKINQPSKAAAWALFSGNIELAIRSLRGNKGKRVVLSENRI